MTQAQAAERGTLTQRAAVASLAMAVSLVGLKLWAVLSTGSVSMLGSLTDTGLDLVASLVTLLSVRLAARPADHDHRFGHGKAEALAALFQTGLISASAIAIAWRAASRMGEAAGPDNAQLGIGVSLAAIVATLALVAYQRSVIRRTGSVAIQADRAHYASDLMLNAAVIAALILDAKMGVRGADPLFGIAIAIWLIWHAVAVARKAVDQLMDKEWPLEKRERFLKIAASHPELEGIHDVRTRTSGTQDFVQLHVWVAPDMTIADAHRVMDEVEARLMAQFPDTEVIIHPEPDGHVAGHEGVAAEELKAP